MENWKEIWKNISGFEGLYQVSSFGRVKSFYGKKEHILKHADRGNGYLFVVLCKEGCKPKLYLIHRLVANAFIPNPENLPIINHKDKNRQNNHADNLEWCTAQYNVEYSLAKRVAQYSHAGKLIKIWPSMMDAARQGFNVGNICLCCQGKRKTHGGFIWRYIEN